MNNDGHHVSLIGQTLGLYKVEALVGQGAMGTVYLARDLSLNRRVALKVLLGSLARNPSLLHRFHLEAQAAAPLQHPNIVRIYSAGIEGGTPYIAMEYIEGEPLDRFIRRQGRIPWQTALYIGQQVAAALDCAHSHRVIHRDVKPANILLDKQGHAQLTDFGIANIATLEKEVGEAEGFIGTPHYMSPEQCAGEEIKPVSDLYSLGVTLYYMISGRLPFDSSSPVVLVKSITNDEAIRLNRLVSDIPDDVARLVAHLMAKEPRDRPHTAQAVIRTIERLQAEKGGRSAMPVALQTFMREQTRIRPVRSLLRPGQVGQDDSHPHRPRLPTHALVARIVAVAGALLIFAGVQLFIGQLTRPRPEAVEAQTAEIFTFNDITSELRKVRFPAEMFDITSVRWIHNSSALVTELIGKPGTLQHNARGLVLLEPDSRNGRILNTPVNILTEPFYSQIRVPTYGPPTVVHSGENRALDHALLDAAYPRSKRFDHTYVQVIASHYENGENRQVVARVPREMWMRSLSPPWEIRHGVGRAIPKPDGHTLCLVLWDPEHDVNFLVERDLQWEEPERLGTRLTSGRNRLVPCSVRYSPNGRYLSYIRLTEKGLRELMVFDFSHDHINGKPIALNIEDCETAFGPDGALMAIRIRRGGLDSELQIISSANGMIVGRLGSGVLGVDPWHPSGDYIVATDDGILYAIETSSPYRRKAISPQHIRVHGGASISDNGRWAAVPIEDSDNVEVLFVQMPRVEFGDNDNEQGGPA